jgi:hypothetical protein
MMRFVYVLMAGMLALAAPALAQDARDRSFGPKRVGAITLGVTKPADLAKIYGAENVKEKTIGYEGGESPGAHIFPDSEDFLELIFDDARERIQSVAILGKNWASAAGLRKGTGLPQLERMNGGPFKFQGFGADEAGRLSTNAAALKPYTIYITLNGAMPKALHVEGTFSSRHPALKGLRPTVSFIRVE